MEKLISAEAFYNEIDDMATKAVWDRRALHFSTYDVLMNIQIQKEVAAIPVKFITDKLYKMTPEEQLFAIKLINEYEAAKGVDKNGRRF